MRWGPTRDKKTPYGVGGVVGIRTSKAPSSKRMGYQQHWEDGEDSV